MKFKNIVNIGLVFLFIGLAGGCEDTFEYSPYAANVKDSYKNVDDKNIEQIIQSDTIIKDVFTIAIIADSHYKYKELDHCVSKINQLSNIDFVVANGDITHRGYLKEYEMFHDEMKKLDMPYITVIGNHDHLSNGEEIYKKMYGERNYTITYNNCLFIIWDNTFWESSSSPDFKWLESMLNESNKYRKTFVICHQPPFSEQFTDEDEDLYKNLMADYNVSLSIHGHIHRFNYEERYGDGINYLCAGDVMDEEFVTIKIEKEKITIEQVKN